MSTFIELTEIEENIESLYSLINENQRKINAENLSTEKSDVDIHKLQDELLEYQFERNQLINEYDKLCLPGKFIKTNIIFHNDD
jgi:hypothetical protein